MRSFPVVFRTAFLEALSEPVVAVLFIAAPLVVHLAPIIHCHQFGEVGRLARECGFSALLVFGVILGAAAAIAGIGREFDEGTAAAAFARPVSRSAFFAAKISGVLAVLALFLVTSAAATMVSVRSAELGADAMARGGLSRVWGPGLAAGVGGALAALTAAAALNRFRRARFCVWTGLLIALSQCAALAGVALAGGGAPWKVAAPMVALAAGCASFPAMAGALRVVLRPAPVAAVTAVAVVAAFAFPLRAVLPDINMFWMVDALANGGCVPLREVLGAVLAGALIVVFWTGAGAMLAERKEVG